MDFITYGMMIPFLQYCAKATHSYGLAIILLTLAVRVAVWPLVSKSTKSMQKMQKLSPALKELQKKYKDDPQELQRKMVALYAANKANPVGGCLPMLIQLPILLALFSTFNGPPFGDKPVDVTVHVIEAKADAKRDRKEVSGSNSPYVSADGKVSKVVVFPGEATTLPGDKIDFGTRAVEGTLPADFKVKWEVKSGNGKLAAAEEAVIDEEGHATFLKKGDYKVEAIVTGIAKNDSFLFINSLGKKAVYLELLKPQNFDLLFMIILFGVTMYLSSKLTMAGPKDPAEMDEQQRVMADSMKYMPIVMSASFVMIPLPAGVFLYMLVSSLVQTFQTWLIMRTSPDDFINPDADSPMPVTSGGGAGANAKVIDIGSAPRNKPSAADGGAKIKFDADKLAEKGEMVAKDKSKKKKKK
ncbi:MAG: membrane protein insertase YidC [Candidatus Obscuribacter sp.]|nr:membrane protein insertase YidC [Candidatus Obscuribacter sp.]MBK7841768.1 membrane protein insertase YidC [Candidatus Obscuribacter sp.]MBK9622371.1 membrane protein insertase YidC [Candidatus Obscuribacter sp.]MBK9773198.1 membrane protein insertase YidC [Candidatus Obscuribacter sp.]MDQ5968431.1 Membrane protein insertase YidC [Cyanobacteriota bacterium erpe_2018_sw_39hr_WHONDRS-SW48-000098_B_bin.30]